MKRATWIIAILGILALATSCSGGNKSCAAYTKAEVGQRPAYHQVQ